MSSDLAREFAPEDCKRNPKWLVIVMEKGQVCQQRTWEQRGRKQPQGHCLSALASELQQTFQSGKK